ncbi:MAG: hypothetical protein LRY51_08030 [Geovibrio sp.]|nr:hypothetical protein [Geovibrio sp.]
MEETDAVIELVSLIRNVRGEYNVSMSKQLKAWVKTDSAKTKRTLHPRQKTG